MKATATPEKGGPLTNRDIRAREVQLIDAEGHNRGVTQIADALQLAEEAGLDLVEIVPNATPPVCKILDFGKFRFLEQKKAAEARKRQKIVEIKEIKLLSAYYPNLRLRASVRSTKFYPSLFCAFLRLFLSFAIFACVRAIGEALGTKRLFPIGVRPVS